MSKETGGPAFPCDQYDSSLHAGMTLRDYFAAQAMLCRFGPRGSALSIENCATYAYEYADAMLAERLK